MRHDLLREAQRQLGERLLFVGTEQEEEVVLACEVDRVVMVLQGPVAGETQQEHANLALGLPLAPMWACLDLDVGNG